MGVLFELWYLAYKEILFMAYCTDNLAKNCYALLIFDICTLIFLSYRIRNFHFLIISVQLKMEVFFKGQMVLIIKGVKIIKLKEKFKIYYESQRKFNVKLSSPFLLPLFMLSSVLPEKLLAI